jgi:hypothetical protein
VRGRGCSFVGWPEQAPPLTRPSLPSPPCSCPGAGGPAERAASRASSTPCCRARAATTPCWTSYARATPQARSGRACVHTGLAGGQVPLPPQSASALVAGRSAAVAGQAWGVGARRCVRLATPPSRGAGAQASASAGRSRCGCSSVSYTGSPRQGPRPGRRCRTRTSWGARATTQPRSGSGGGAEGGPRIGVGVGGVGCWGRQLLGGLNAGIRTGCMPGACTLPAGGVCGPGQFCARTSFSRPLTLL